jgi:Site-specific recombinase XerD
MAIYPTKNGKYKARISYRDDNGKVVVKDKVFSTRREAKNYEVDFLRSIRINKSPSMTYREITQLYIEKIGVTARPSTIDDYEKTIERYCYDILDTSMTKLSKKMYLDVWLRISNSDRAHATKNKAIKLLKAIGKYAYIYHDYTDYTKTLDLLKKKSSDIKDMQIWSVEELSKILEKVDNYVYKTSIHFLYYTGLRFGEFKALQKEDIKGGRCFINKSMNHASSGFDELKTHQSKRNIALDKTTLKLIEPLFSIDGNFLFGGLDPVSSSTLRRVMVDASRKSGVKLIKIHELRHSHASFLLNNGANVLAVSKRLGHSSIQTTLNIYAHLLSETEDKLIDIIENY